MSKQHDAVTTAKALADGKPETQARTVTGVLNTGASFSRGFLTQAAMEQWLASQPNIDEVTSVR